MATSVSKDRTQRAIFYGIGLISLASLLFELTLTRIFSVVMYYHFAFMVISLAMFGFGVSGLVAYFKPNWFPIETLGKTLWRQSLYFSISTLISLLIVLQAQIDLSFRQENIIKLVMIYLVSAVPFFFVGICVSVAMTHLSAVIGKLYFYDLLGASIGCMLAIPVMNFCGGPGAVLVAAALAALGGFFFAQAAREEAAAKPSTKDSQRNPFLIGLGGIGFLTGAGMLVNGFSKAGQSYLTTAQFSSVAVIAFLVGSILLVSGFQSREKARTSLPVVLMVSLLVLAFVNTNLEFLRVIFTKGAREQNIIFSEWNSFSRISVEVDPESQARTMRIDADAATHVVRTSGRIEDEQPFRHGVSGAAYHIRENVDQVLIIGPGGGWDIATAAAHHAHHITGCEINPIIVNSVMKGKFRDYTGGLYEFPNVKVNVGEGRSFIRNSNQKFNIIQATLVDTWAATAGGALSLTENNLYTVEAFEDYLNHLTDDGIITMSRWLLQTDQQNLRLTVLGLKALERFHVSQPERHFMLVSSGSGLEATQQKICCFMLKKTPFTDQEVRQMESEAAKYNFSIVYTPLTKPDNVFTRLLTARDRDEFIRNYPYEISPTYDNKPFFFFTLKPKDFINAFSGDYEMVKNNAGLLALVSLLAIVFVLACGCILIPLVLFRREALKRDTWNRFRAILYFAGLGIGFMALEMALLQKFVFFLGHPVYALAVVLFSILLFSGIGSNYTEQIQVERATTALRWIVIGMCVLVAIYLAVLPALLYQFLGLAVPIKIGISVILLAPLSVLMGMPLPLGIKVIRPSAADLIPWAWGVNGAMSVLGSVLAVSLAINMGYNALLVFGVGVYIVASLSLPGKLANESHAETTDDLPLIAGAKA